MADNPVKTVNWQRHADHSILLVDDNTDVLVATGAFLAKEGFLVQMSANGDEALRLVANDPKIDILITDFAMPGLSGVDLIAQAAEIRPAIRTLLITGYPNADGLAELTASTTVLVKPFRGDTLIANIKAILNDMQAVSNETMELIDRNDMEAKKSSDHRGE
jgi:DNA-binding NtrC family response regulator